MKTGIFKHGIRCFLSSMIIFMTALLTIGSVAIPLESFAKRATKSKSHSTISRKKTKRSKSKKKSGKRKSTKKRTYTVSVIHNGKDGTWIHKGRRSIIISRDSLGIVRAMTPFTTNPHAGKDYAEAINEYSRLLQNDGVRVYCLIAPTQGEYYMPELTSTRGAEQHAIKVTAGYLDKSVTPVYVDSIFKCHLDEEIYNRTDHHWSPLGAYYASEELARAAGVKFRQLNEYTPDTVRNYVGTMYNWSGDPQVKANPEEFVWFIPPEGYKTEYIDYHLSNGHTVGESEKRTGSFFRRFNDGSTAAYCTFMGGDSRTTAVTNTGGTPERRLLIVKDSYGNAMASHLFGSFEEVHVIDFRYFPHNLLDYIRGHHITDLCFVNCTSLAFAPDTARRLNIMLGKSVAPPVSRQGNADVDEDEDDLDEIENENEEAEDMQAAQNDAA